MAQVRPERADRRGELSSGTVEPEGEAVARERSDAEQQVADLLVTAKKSLHLSVAFLTRMVG